ncbi:MAG TPA: SurA N-terminal domain-containing protein [Anaerolineae bacterium]|nr:SurA N-terminal domain-containing protein [Anaerolineae bacterium]HQI85507.1 SurA N-terminal domain-containing protein [Anaerolineae bacterium]
MPKQENPQKELNRRQLARREKEKRLNKILVWSAIGVVALVVLIIGYGVVAELILKPAKPVAKVDGVNITTKAYQTRLYYERLLLRRQLEAYQNYLLQLDQNDETTQSLYQQLQTTASNLETQLSNTMSSVIGKQVLDDMVEEELVRAEAQSRNLTVSDDDITLSIEQMVGYDRTAAETVTDTSTIESFDSLYQRFQDNILKESNFSEEAFRTMMKTNLLKNQLKAIIGADVAQTAEQIETTFFTAADEEATRALQERINNGADVAALVEELNNDEDDLTAGYSLSWLPIGYLGSQLGTTIEQVAFNTPVGKAAEPTMANDGRYYVVYVSGHEDRALDESLLEQGREQKYTEWLEQQKQARCEYLNWQDAVLTSP